MVRILTLKITTKRRYIQDIGLICWQAVQIIPPRVLPFRKIIFLFFAVLITILNKSRPGIDNCHNLVLCMLIFINNIFIFSIYGKRAANLHT